MADEHSLPIAPIPSMVNDREEDHQHDASQGRETKLATVKMLLDSIGQTVTVAFPLQIPIHELITYFSKELRMPVNVLHIRFNGEYRIISFSINNLLFSSFFFVLIRQSFGQSINTFTN